MNNEDERQADGKERDAVGRQGLRTSGKKPARRWRGVLKVSEIPGAPVLETEEPSGGRLNFGPVCECGGEKKAGQQWCETCWDSLPSLLQRSFNMAAQSLFAVIDRAERHAKIEREVR